MVIFWHGFQQTQIYNFEGEEEEEKEERILFFFFFNASPTIFWALLFAFHVWSQIMLTTDLGENYCPHFINEMMEVQRC